MTASLQRDPKTLPHAAPFEALGMVMLCFGWFILASLDTVSNWRADSAVYAASSHAFTDTRFVVLLVAELTMGSLALLVLKARGYPLRTLVPQPSWRGLLAGASLYLGATLLITLVLPLVPHPSDTPLDRILAGAHLSWPVVVAVSLANGVYEEVFLLGYLMRGLRRYGASTAIGVALLVRLLYHMYQGPLGALSVTLFGIVLGLYYQRTGRLFPVVAAHVITDIIGLLYSA